MGWTPRQEEAITKTGKSLLVSAAAGSGKTSVLVERVTQLLSKGASLDRMLVVTFTNAAAGEMKERIADRLGAASVRNSHISTFHSFALDIIRRYYYVTGINPSLAVSDEYRQSILKNKAMDRMFEEYFEADDPDFIDFLNCYATAKSNYTAQQMIFEMHRFLESLPDPEAFLNACEDLSMFSEEEYFSFAAEQAKASVERIRAYTLRARDILLDPQKDGALPMPVLAGKLDTDISGLDSIIAALDSDPEKAFSAIKGFSFVRLAKTKAETASYGFVEDDIETLKKVRKKELDTAKDTFGEISFDLLEKEKKALRKPVSELVKLTRRFDELYRQGKEKEGLMDFADIEHFALDILRSDAVADELRDGFDYIFVDEYQDSNSVQDCLISRIAREDNVFFVGDVKQSIYKFRNAEPELFEEKYNRFKSGSQQKAAVIDLNANFRSKKPVIDFVNKVFSCLMNAPGSGIVYDEDASLVEGNPYEGEGLYDPRLYLIQETSDEDVDSEIEDLRSAQLEALCIASVIKQYHGKPVYDSKKKVMRPLEYGDMAILMRSVKTRGEYVYKALTDADIPVYLQREGGYFDTPEIQVCLNLMRITDNFRQDVPLISVLSFPSFGFTPEQLAEIRIHANEKKLKIPFSEAVKLYAKEGPDETISEDLNSFLTRIDLWRKKAAYLPLDDFVWELMNESGILSYAAALPSGNQRTANLRLLVDKAREYEQMRASGLFGFISYIEVISQKGKGVDTGQVSVLPEGADAVRIMTIHKSKGLEFPLVLLAGTGSRIQSSKEKIPLCTHKDLGISMKIAEPAKGLVAEPTGTKLIALKKKQDDMAETVRVLYVAMTRAKDVFLMSAVCRNIEERRNTSRLITKENPAAASCYIDLLLPFVPAKDIEYVSKSRLAQFEKNEQQAAENILSCLDTGFEVDESELPLSKAEIAERLNYDYSPDPQELMKSKYSVSEIAELERTKEDMPAAMSNGIPWTPDKKGNKSFLKHHSVPRFVSEAEPDAAEKGTAYHLVMEHLPFTAEEKSPGEIELFIEELVKKNMMTEAQAKALDASRISAFFSSSIGQRAIAAEKLWKEAPFVLRTEYEGRTVYVQGTIDCYFEEDGQYVLVDYKSNFIDGLKSPEAEKEKLRKEYVPQLRLYKRALEEITDHKVKETVLYLFGINDTVSI